MEEKLTHRVNGGILYIDLRGRIDANNAGAVEESIRNIRKENPGLHTVLDADNLSYISSAGLRILIRLRKEESTLAVINVSSEVYQIFEITGFTDILTIEKAYPRLSVEGCEFIARGANGAVYRYDPETVVKVYFNPDALPEIEQERRNSRTAFVLGVNTAIPYGIVRVGNGYGTKTELLNAIPLSRLIPDRMEEAVAYFVDTIRDIHTLKAEPGTLPKMRDQVLEWVDFLKDHLPEAQYRKLHELVSALPDIPNLLHGDYHTGNIMIQNGEALLIDLDTLSTGHPILELAFMFNAFIGFSETEPESSNAFLGYSFTDAQRFWQLSLERYLGTQDEAVLRCVEEKAMVIGYTRMLRRAIRRSQPDREARIHRCKEQLASLLTRVDTLTF